MKKIKPLFNKYLPFSKGVVLSNMQYRMRFLFWFFMNFLSIFITYFLWRAVYSSTDAGLAGGIINGYSFSSMIIYLFMTSIVSNLTYMEVSEFIADDINDGAIAMRLIKPLSYRGQLFFQGFGGLLTSFIFFVIPFTIVIIVFGKTLGIVNFTTTPVTIILFLISIILGTCVRYFISFCFGMIIFLTINSFGVWQLREAIERVLSGSLIPISLFPIWMQWICNYTPFSQYIYVPISIFLGENIGLSTNDSLIAILIQIVWIVILAFLSSLMWKKAIKKVVVQGG